MLVLEVDPLELARQFACLESRIYCAIQPRELIGQAWSKDKPNATNVLRMSGLSTQITTWVAEVILSDTDVKKRAMLLKQFIKIADVSCFIVDFVL